MLRAIFPVKKVCRYNTFSFFCDGRPTLVGGSKPTISDSKRPETHVGRHRPDMNILTRHPTARTKLHRPLLSGHIYHVIGNSARNRHEKIALLPVSTGSLQRCDWPTHSMWLVYLSQLLVQLLHHSMIIVRHKSKIQRQGWRNRLPQSPQTHLCSRLCLLDKRIQQSKDCRGIDLDPCRSPES